ncbi:MULTISPECIES: hypothetical protein [unclassified Sulfitobacter]|jgi:hypothetical protein|uniref:hypothetical protein n=1 Tax=unclassified Sulfitobacter TaxID=196795 RepID=UPI0007C2E489|nr:MULTISPECIES: hypothetical protein [unclassified Sulfitobacter]KZY01816.1 hypothetical protein A3721_00370 [Sulfitobacter sp. HI0023]KZY24216.1 hypothetical protein A3728_06130 [Sulfitobacter sp. HI0040]KZZ69043.1 hypothetical protein A3764_11810 [Sulfitobacter sp. HI0129]
MTAADWSYEGNDTIAAEYLLILSEELLGRRYNKAAQNRSLQNQIGRSRDSIEFKISNVAPLCGPWTGDIQKVCAEVQFASVAGKSRRQVVRT